MEYKTTLDVDIKPHFKGDYLGRPVESASLGPHLEGICQPRVDTRDPTTQALGVMARMGKVIPAPKDDQFYNKLKKFVLNTLVKRGVKPLSPDADLSFDTWILNTNYPEWRRSQLRKVNEDRLKLDETKVQYGERGERRDVFRHFNVKLFTKEESYVSEKHSRGIYARSDEAKCHFGPAVKAMENVIYDHEHGFKEFIKHVPVMDRAEFIWNNLYTEGNVYLATDYTSFESHFNPELMKACEFVLYEYMLQYHPFGNLILADMKACWLGVNSVSNQKLRAEILASRMSGEMNTSLGNGFSNLMLMLYLCDARNVDPRGVVEGDDGLFAFPADNCPTSTEFADLGCLIKLEQKPLSNASFCGLVFDEKDRKVITDPKDVIADLAWCGKRYAFASPKTKMALLRSKALSTLCCYPACPMVSEFARYVLRETRSYNIEKIYNSRNTGWWEREMLVQVKLAKVEKSPPEPIGEGTRFLVQELYGLNIDHQLRFEESMRTRVGLDPILDDELYGECPEAWKRYFDNFVIQTSRPDPIQEFPWANHSMLDPALFGKRPKVKKGKPNSK